ncbi:damage-inducible protein DinB [Paenibacillus hemerocallicola]|uniref:Damage-inducible protein DinB n=1 Tax=Paenibacillus hemerocallicola TaxID=1172614 RepID=A0A5C4T925_9BACL|nr:DinB family protein [Paenibacillus hemerocallicola]TNJ64859.1 damage-inducible protein DinB [Paenibacillus hemerocallicola]
MKSYVMRQYDYHVWANKKVCDYLQELPEEVYRKEIVSVFPTIHDVLTHIYVIDCNWLTFLSRGGVVEMSAQYIADLKAETDRLVAETNGKNAGELGRMMDDLADRFHIFLEQHDNLEQLCPSGDFKASYIDFIQHLVNHGTYHRGNITAMLRQLGYPGTPTDFGYYLYVLSKQ